MPSTGKRGAASKSPFASEEGGAVRDGFAISQGVRADSVASSVGEGGSIVSAAESDCSTATGPGRTASRMSTADEALSRAPVPPADLSSGDWRTFDEVCSKGAAVRQLAAQITARAALVEAALREALRTVEDDAPKEVRRAGKANKETVRLAREVEEAAAREHAAGVAEVAATCEALGLARPTSQVSSYLSRAQEALERAAAAAREAKEGAARAEELTKSGVEDGAETNELGRDALDLLEELSVKEQVHTISRLAARAVQAAEQGYLDSAASKCKEAERNGMLLDAQLGRVEADALRVQGHHRSQRGKFAQALKLLGPDAEEHLEGARSSAGFNLKLHLKAGDALHAWRRRQEERQRASKRVELEAKAALLAKELRGRTEGHRRAQESARRAVRAAALDQEEILAARPELLGACKCGRPRDCAECRARAEKGTRECPLVPFGTETERGPLFPTTSAGTSLGPGRYESWKADGLVRPGARQPNLGKTYAPMPTPWPLEHPNTVWARTLRPRPLAPPLPAVKAPNKAGKAANNKGGGPGVASGGHLMLAAALAGGEDRDDASSGSNASEFFRPKVKILRGAAAEEKAKKKAEEAEAKRQQVLKEKASRAHRLEKRIAALARFRKHLKAGGSSIVPKKEFLALLRSAGLKNPDVMPWLHGCQPLSKCMGTHFEADDYKKPNFICLGCKSELVDSPNYQPTPL